MTTPLQKNILDFINLNNLQGPNLIGTAERVAKAWHLFLHPEPFELTSFIPKGKTGMIFIKNHECWSFCPHHLLPVRYTVKVGYLPEKEVLGLSKLARIADDQMRHMPLQEELASMIAQPIIDCLQPKGVGVIIQGEHMCMRMRGVESTHSEAVSTLMWGLFLEDPKAREEFILL